MGWIEQAIDLRSAGLEHGSKTCLAKGLFLHRLRELADHNFLNRAGLDSIANHHLFEVSIERHFYVPLSHGHITAWPRSRHLLEKCTCTTKGAWQAMPQCLIYSQLRTVHVSIADADECCACSR